MFIGTLLYSSSLLAWNFNQDDYNRLSEKQKVVIKDSYVVGELYNLGYTLAALSIVETRAGEYKDSNNNRICGPHQIDVKVALEQTNSKGDYKKLCKNVQNHSILSSHLALRNLIYWKKHSKGYRQMVNRYNRGWNRTSHDLEFLRRFEVVLKVLQKNQMNGIL